MNIDFINAGRGLFSTESLFKHDLLTGAQFKSGREIALSRALVALAAAHNVSAVVSPLDAEPMGASVMITAAAKNGRPGAFGTFADLLNQYQPARSAKVGDFIHLLDTSATCWMHHLHVEKMVKEIYWKESKNFILAEAHTDDHRHTAVFNAAPFFEEASDYTIRVIAEEGWGGQESADRVAEYLDGKDPAVTKMFVGKHAGPKQGFECNIDVDSALGWLKAHRPELSRALACQSD